MNQIIFLLMSLVGQQVASESHKIFPARIISQHKTIRENSDLHVTCSTFGSKKTSKVYLYLCKDGNVVGKMEQALHEDDTIITVNRVGQNASGNYCCVYSYSEFNTSRVTQQGLNIIPILIISASFLSADISVSGPSTVTQGEDVEFRCTVSDKVQMLGGCQLIQSYLMKNDSILQVKVFDVARMMANFTVKGALRRDSGLYSCVVLPSQCIQEGETLSGNNAVLLQVKESYQRDLRICCGILAMCLLSVLGLWLITNSDWISRDNLTSLKSRRADQNTRIDVLEQKQRDGQDLEEQDAAVTDTDGDSFSSEDDDGYEAHFPTTDDQLRCSDVLLYSNIQQLRPVESPGDSGGEQVMLVS